jgi:hypothetical protein
MDSLLGVRCLAGDIYDPDDMRNASNASVVPLVWPTLPLHIELACSLTPSSEVDTLVVSKLSCSSQEQRRGK